MRVDHHPPRIETNPREVLAEEPAEPPVGSRGAAVEQPGHREQQDAGAGRGHLASLRVMPLSQSREDSSVGHVHPAQDPPFIVAAMDVALSPEAGMVQTDCRRDDLATSL